MPNYCECEVTCKSKDPKVLQSIVDLMASDTTESKFDFTKIVPYPEVYRILDDEAESCSQIAGMLTKDESDQWSISWGSVRDGYNQGGYQWCSDNWGTKWNASWTQQVKLAKQSCWFGFKTAWCAPTPVMEELSRRYPDVPITLKWWEQGKGKKGIMTFLQGCLLTDETFAYHGKRGG